LRRLGQAKTHEQILPTFETWESTCGLKLKNVEPSEECESGLRSRR